MIRRIGFEGQRVLFGMDRNDAYDQGICIRCGTHPNSRLNYLELESLCRTCWTQLNEIGDQPIPIKLSIQVGEHVGDCIAVPPEWDGFTCLNGLVSNRIPRNELRTLCETAENVNSVIRLPDEVSSDHVIFLVPNAHGRAYRGSSLALAAWLKLLTEVCSPNANFDSLLTTHFSHEANPTSLVPLKTIWQAIYSWHLFKDFGSLKEILIGVHPEAAKRISDYVDERREFTAEFTDRAVEAKFGYES